MADPELAIPRLRQRAFHQGKVTLGGHTNTMPFQTNLAQNLAHIFPLHCSLHLLWRYYSMIAQLRKANQGDDRVRTITIEIQGGA
jgi:hypothetical protein